MSAHRYWRIYTTTTDYGGNVCLAEVAMSASVGGPTAIGTGVASASSSVAGYPASAAIDGSVSTWWNVNGSMPAWWEYDFVTPIDILQVTITSRSDHPTTAPTLWSLQSSDDNSTWTTENSYESAAWVAATPQVFVNLPILIYWRINCDSCAYGSYVSIAELAMASVQGGSDLITSTSGIAATSSELGITYRAGAAIDGNTTTYWSPAGGAATGSWQFGFFSNVTIKEVKITARSDVPSTAPSKWDLQRSTDNTTWTTVQTFYPAAWTAGQTQTFEVGQHRYWRISFDTNEANQYPCLSEVSFAASYGGANVLGAGTASASTLYSASYPAANACDGNAATYWNGTVSGVPGWWAYDFGAGNAFAVREVKITCRADDPTRSPWQWTLDYSDDNSTWTTASGFCSQLWTAGSQQTFQVPLFTGTTHRYWRLANMNAQDSSNLDFPAISILEMAAVTGGTSLLGGGTATASTSFSGRPPTLALDGNNTTSWSAGGTAANSWLQYDFGSTAVSIGEIRIYPISGSYNIRSPASFDLQYSDDNTTFVTLQHYACASWSNNAMQAFEYPAPFVAGTSGFSPINIF